MERSPCGLVRSEGRGCCATLMLGAASYSRPGIFSNLLGGVVGFIVGIPACVRFGINGMAASLVAAQLVNLTIFLGFHRVTLKVRSCLFWAFNLDLSAKTGEDRRGT
jgi:hypothetical protein